MTAPREDVWITGLGVVSPLGRGAAEVMQAAVDGRSGLVRNTDASLPVEVVARAPEIAAADHLPGPAGTSVDRFVLLALAAADDAVRDAELVVGESVAADRVGVVVSSASGGLGTFEAQAVARAGAGRTGVSPFLLPGMLPNMGSARVAIALGATGPSTSVSTACAAGAHSVAEGLRLIREGRCDVVVVGGADAPLNPTAATAFANARALAKGWEHPEQASRPFDVRRNGFVLGEGAAVLVLERADTARARGASAYAVLAGWGASTDAHHPTSPRPDGAGAAQAMRAALDDAGLEPADVGYVNAHGTATKLGDVAEALALRTVFGDDGPAVSSTKGGTGHLLGAAGALEAVLTAGALATGIAPPTLNLDAVDDACRLDHVAGKARELRPGAALTNSFAFGGHNVSLALRPAVEAPRALEVTW